MRSKEYFDGWYADMDVSPAKDELVARHLGTPPDLGLGGVLPYPALAELAAGLGVPEGGLLVDVACGRGAYGVELARRAGSRVVGVDFSRVALEQARRTAGRRLAPGRAGFVVGTLTRTGLTAAGADAVLCSDSVQFAEPPVAALAEFRRLLVPGGRLALTTWEAASPGDPRAPERIRRLDLRRDLASAGFRDATLEERPDWRAAERALFEEAVARDDADDTDDTDDTDDIDGGDAAVAALAAEGRRTLPVFDALRRVVVLATAG